MDKQIDNIKLQSANEIEVVDDNLKIAIKEIKEAMAAEKKRARNQLDNASS